MLRQVDDEALPFGIRQDVRGRQNDRRVLAGNPGVDALVGRDHLDITEAVGAREVEQCVFVGGDDMAQRADHVA